ncbi:MAG: PqqD family peptide modification chaperone [Pseudomonadota bacterium]
MNSSIYKQVEECLLEDMDGELLLYNPATAVTLHLNGPSAIIWKLLDGQRSVADIIDVVKEAYPEQSEQIDDDVSDVVKDLHERQVLELVE